MSDGKETNGADTVKQGTLTVRDAQEDDMEWVVPHVSAFYADECSWHQGRAESRAKLVPWTLKRNIPRFERAWIAARAGERTGCAFLTRNSNQEAQLRLLVAPDVRGAGIGTRLLDECVQFAREAGYRRIRVWTIEILMPAHRLFATQGFRMIHKEEQLEPGQRFADETWELDLEDLPARNHNT